MISPVVAKLLNKQFSKLICTKQGFFEFKQFTSVFEIYIKPTSVAMATNICEF